MILAWAASRSGVVECAIIRNPTVSRPISRARPKCWTEMSASVQCVAMRHTLAPFACAALMSSFTPRPGSIRNAMRAWRAVSTAALMSSCSGVFENP